MSTAEQCSRLKRLDEVLGTPVLFALASSTVGLVSGFITGGVTAVMTNIVETPAARPHILRLTRIFGLAGIVHGLVGAGLIAVGRRDDYTTRAVSGCAAGLSVGMSQGKIGLACGMCLGLGALSVLERGTSSILREEDRKEWTAGRHTFAPAPTRDYWLEAWKDRIRETSNVK